MTTQAKTAAAAGTEALRVATGGGPAPIGEVLVACTARGIAAILLGEAPEALARELRDRFPGARLLPADAAAAAALARVLAFLAAPRAGLGLALDPRGTAFQQRVWQALREIPPGATATYAGIAARIGAPRATRAVARACAANPLAVAIPCHRVLRQDGAPSGYRWGPARRRALLALEAAA